MSTLSWSRRCNNFQNSKEQCLGKRDKSFAGRIDVKAVDICSHINAREEFYTTSSCSGRCFLYRGRGTKSLGDDEVFERFRISHDIVRDPTRYFDLTTFESDPTGGGDAIRSIGQFEHKEKLLRLDKDNKNEEIDKAETEELEQFTQVSFSNRSLSTDSKTTWLRFEPFILHVCCRSLTAASSIMHAARPAFKNVGLTSWKSDTSKYLVAIWGDEGLDMPLSSPKGLPLYEGMQDWLGELVNERHERNWSKIARFVQAVKEMGPIEETVDGCDSINVGRDTNGDVIVPRSFDVIGDIALLHTMPPGDGATQEEVGRAIMRKNKAIKVCVARTSSLNGTERSPGNLVTIAGPERSPLVTSHTEYGIKCVVDLNQTFFSPRMAPERLRICQQVARGEHVLVLFAGVAMDAMQIAGRTEASSIVAIEMNPVAVQCARRAQRMLERNKAVKCIGAAERLTIMEGDVLDILPTLEKGWCDRVLAPRPKEGALDGDLGNGDGGVAFLEALLPIMKEQGGECHWYDFCSDSELPTCERTRESVKKACDKMGLSMEVIHVATAGSVAKRQNRVCLDFRLTGKVETT